MQGLLAVLLLSVVAADNRIGLGLNSGSKTQVSAFGGKGVGWYYSWDTNQRTGTDGIEFVPMIWGPGSVNELDKGIPPGTKYILSFNEPDIPNLFGGSEMTPELAATLHKQWTAKVPAGIEIGAPVVSQGGDAWIAKFYDACGADGCRVDFVPIHYFGFDANGFIAFAKQYSVRYRKPLWVTEIACKEHGPDGKEKFCSEDQTKVFMKTVIDWMRGNEGKDIVKRWAWFGALRDRLDEDPNSLISKADGSVNAMGTYYASL